MKESLLPSLRSGLYFLGLKDMILDSKDLLGFLYGTMTSCSKDFLGTFFFPLLGIME
jgi:hypothetical protein